MRCRTVALLLLTASAAAVAAQVPGSDQASGRAKLQGTWSLLSVRRDGRSESPEELRGRRVRVKDDRFVAQNGTTDEEVLTFTLVPGHEPPAIDFRREGAQMAARGIYEVDGDRLRICLVTDEKRERPQSFSAEEGSGQRLMVLGRAKSERPRGEGFAGKVLFVRTRAKDEPALFLTDPEVRMLGGKSFLTGRALGRPVEASRLWMPLDDVSMIEEFDDIAEMGRWYRLPGADRGAMKKTEPKK